MAVGLGLTLSICLRCRDGREGSTDAVEQRGGCRLARAVVVALDNSSAAEHGLILRGVHCMSQCKRPCTIALSGPSRFSYLFGDLDPTQHVGDVLTVAAAYAQSADGFLPRSARPDVLRTGILGRIPPLDVSNALVEPISPVPIRSLREG